jgi:hypothetical protein
MTDLPIPGEVTHKEIQENAIIMLNYMIEKIKKEFGDTQETLIVIHELSKMILYADVRNFILGHKMTGMSDDKLREYLKGWVSFYHTALDKAIETSFKEYNEVYREKN